jgi:hypothetical protein
MASHILLKYATRRPYKEIPDLPPDAIYDPIKGLWILDGNPLVDSEEYGLGPRVTKKCDQETGEDQKGE